MTTKLAGFVSAVLAATVLLPAFAAAPAAVPGPLPLRFEPESMTGVFRAMGPGFALQVSPAQARFAAGDARLSMLLDGADPSAGATGLHRLESVSNYLRGNDRSQWRIGVPNFARVRYNNVYSGIDLVYYGTSSRLEYDFVVAPQADPSAIALRFPDAGELSLSAEGDLVIHTPGGDSVHKRPVIYQEVAGARVAVDGAYRIDEEGRVRFRVGPYDRAHPLTIDPVLQFSTYYGGRFRDVANGLVLDRARNIYLTGTATSTDFPVSTGAFQSQLIGDSDIFVVKLNATGTTVFYSTLIGGSGQDTPGQPAVDSNGNLYLGGTTNSANFPTTPGAYKVFPLGGPNDLDGFVLKLNQSGTELTYCTRIGGKDRDHLNAVAVDTGGNAYVTGDTSSADFPITSEDVFQDEMRGAIDVFVTKINSTGSGLVWSTFLGGDNDSFIVAQESGKAIAVNRSGQVFVAGETTLRDFPTSGAPQSEHLGQFDIFVTGIAADGESLLWSTFLGGEGVENLGAMSLDPTGANVYVAGDTASRRYPVTPQTFQSFFGPGDENRREGFLTRLNGSGQIVYSTFFGGNRDDQVTGVVGDAEGRATIFGTTSSTNLATTNDALQAGLNSGTGSSPFDTFIASFNSAGTQTTFVTYLGGRRNETSGPIARDDQGNLYIAGYTESTDFPTTPGAIRRASGVGTPTTFLARLGESRPGPVSLNILSGNNQTADEGTALPLPLMISLLDAFGNGVSGATVSFFTTAGTLSAPTAVTDGLGRASVQLTLPLRPGTVKVTVRQGELPPVEFSIVSRRVGPPLPEISAADGVIGAGRGLIAVRHLSPGGRAIVKGRAFIVSGADEEAIPDRLVNGQLPTNLAGLCLTVGGVAARLLSVSPNEILFQVPEIDTLGMSSVVVITNCGRFGELRSDPREVELRAASPEFFYYNVNQQGRSPVQAIRADTGDPIGPDGTSATPNSVVRAFGTGFGRTDPVVGSGEFPTALTATAIKPVVILDGEDLPAEDVLYAGLTPGYPGIYHVDFRVPARVRNGNISLVVRFDQQSSPDSAYVRITGGEDRAPRISTAPTRIEFGDVVRGQAVSRPLTVANAGTAPLVITSFFLDARAFTVTPNFGFRLLPGETRVVNVNLNATALGPAEATLAIGTDDPATPNLNVPLSANIIEQPPTPNPVPVISSILPNTIESAGASFNLVVNGSGFVRGSVVEVNGEPRSTFFNHPAQLIALVRAQDIVSAGDARITVFTPAPGGGRSEPITLTVRTTFAPNQPLSLINQMNLRFCPTVISYVSVQDSAGQSIRGITRERVTCREEGEEIDCTIAPAQAVAPVSLTIVLGMNGLTAEQDQALIRSAAKTLVNSLDAPDSVAIVHLEDQARPLLPFTVDKDKALVLIDQLRPVPPGNALYDAVVAASTAYRAEQDRRHIVVLFTALGNQSGNLVDLTQATGTARGTGVTFYTVAVGPGTADVALTGFLRELARDTFGQFFSEPSALQFSSVAGRIGNIIQSQYAIQTNARFIDFRQKPLSFSFRIPEGTVTATRNYAPCNP
ncbi:MAG: SBBP repeat-containing protein [Bryobacteraceae bacterium]